MKLAEAIRHMQEDIDCPGSVAIEDVNKAEALGIEALIRERNNRINPGAYRDVLLPGETKD